MMRTIHLDNFLLTTGQYVVLFGFWTNLQTETNKIRFICLVFLQKPDLNPYPGLFIVAYYMTWSSALRLTLINSELLSPGWTLPNDLVVALYSHLVHSEIKLHDKYNNKTACKEWTLEGEVKVIRERLKWYKVKKNQVNYNNLSQRQYLTYFCRHPLALNHCHFE